MATDSTPDEPWTLTRPAAHWYNAQADWVSASLGRGPGCCLVIGSPLFEAQELSALGWDVLYVDVRAPPPVNFPFITGDAAEVSFMPESFDAASSTCVLCHAGLGRYGDPVDARADVKILSNIHRALKPGGKAAITFGPVFRLNETVRFGRIHRVYARREVREMVKPMRILEERIFNMLKNAWVPDVNDENVIDCDYLSMLLEKP